MKLNTKNISIRLLVGLLTFTTGITVTLLLVVPRFRTVRTPRPLKASEPLKDEEGPLPEGRKKLEIKNQVSLRLPQDMKPAEPIGDSVFYREAYSNGDIHITIVYDLLVPELEKKIHRWRAYSCDTPHFFVGRPTYHESVIDIDGRKAKLGIDHDLPPESITALVCFPSADDRAAELRLAAICNDERALETIEQIFRSIRFKDNR